MAITDRILHGPDQADACVEFALAHAGAEVLVVVPDDDAEKAAAEQIKSSFEQKGARISGTTRNPFKVFFANGSRILVRQPRADGRGVKGLCPHLVWVAWDSEPPRTVMVEIVEMIRPEVGD
jgi:hypothetical protein